MDRPIRVVVSIPVYKPYVPKLYAKHRNDPTPLPHGLLHPATRSSIANTLSYYKNDVEFAINTVLGDACLDRARGGLYGLYKEVREQREVDYLWMLDGDVSWAPDALGRLIDRGLPLVGAAYCLKQDEAEKNRKSAARFRPDRNIDESGLTEAEYLNGGFMLIADKTLVALEEAHPELRYVVNPPSKPNRSCALWQPYVVPYPPWLVEMYDWLEPGDGEYISEDWAFSQRARAIGALPMNDCSIEIGHWDGKRCYRLPPWG